MTKPYIVDKTKKTPNILFDQSIGKLEIAGYSLPVNSQEFYQPLFQLVSEYLSNPQPITELVFHIEYFNTSSSKIILHLLTEFEILISMGKEVSAVWYIDDEDSDMYEAGEAYKSSVKIPITILPLQAD